MKIHAFRGYRYGIGRAADVTSVVAPPYDQISPEMQRRLHEMDPHNIVRVTLARKRTRGDCWRGDTTTRHRFGAT